MPADRLSSWAVPAVLAMSTLAPALAVALTGRNLATFEALTPLEPSALSVWLLRLATLSSVGLLAWVVLTRRTFDLARSTRPGDLWLILAFLVFFATNVVVPGMLGGGPSGIPRQYFYVLLLFVALYATRSDSRGPILAAAGWALLVLIAGSILFSFWKPSATLRGYAAELRLPLVPFRFWGLGSGPNSIAPLALTLLLLALSQPFPRRWVQATAIASAAVVILLAQSQTTWLATALIVPMLLLYRRALARGRPVPPRVPMPSRLGLAGLAVAGLVIAAAVISDGPPERVGPTNGLPGQDAALTGRGAIWRVALDLYAAYPLFGYGLQAWEAAFRNSIAMSFAVHAHNQVMQSLSVAGTVGAIGLVVYFIVLARASIASAVATRGLAPALMTLVVLRCMTEVPFLMGTLLVGDILVHALIFALALSPRPGGEPLPGRGGPLPSPARSHRSPA
jgi:O-antigen ligase